MSDNAVTLSTEEEILKALSEMEDEGLLSKAEGDEEETDEDEESEDAEDNTNAEVEGGSDDDEDEEDEDEEGVEKGMYKDGNGGHEYRLTEKGGSEYRKFDKGMAMPADEHTYTKKGDMYMKKAEKEEEEGEDVEKAIDMHPILNSFQKQIDMIAETVQKMSGNQSVVLKGINEKVNDLSKGIDEVGNWSTGRRSIATGDVAFSDRFEKGGDASQVLDPSNRSHKNLILKALDNVVFGEDGVVTNDALMTGITLYESANDVTKSLVTACAKEGILLKGYTA
jgi:hypothetical protein